MSRRDDTLKCLLKKDYKDIKFLKDDGEWCYYQVSTFWSGKHKVLLQRANHHFIMSAFV
ncbi:hypothetical protein NW134_11665 [Staphylococcus pettenkoferi]|uniref:hypothetical protein n=1 Tax=Staphylococcus pettenkoferi TaxID=170573 RepID=UPI0016435E57|nr:hypothetical protein [Staphylococcus pettenkoferi]MCY1593554.1 hypothetical protein [Staphylococcus pettenkoferi]